MRNDTSQKCDVMISLQECVCTTRGAPNFAQCSTCSANSSHRCRR